MVRAASLADARPARDPRFVSEKLVRLLINELWRYVDPGEVVAPAKKFVSLILALSAEPDYAAIPNVDLLGENDCILPENLEKPRRYETKFLCYCLPLLWAQRSRGRHDICSRMGTVFINLN